VTTGRKIRFATDLCTFYDPAYWGHEGGFASIGDLFTWGNWDELTFWNRILDEVQQAGLDGIEITFAPGDWTSALTAYGSAGLRQRGSKSRSRGLLWLFLVTRPRY
jgi:inosose dehydratase